MKKQLSSWAEAYVSPLFLLLVTIAVLMIGASDAWAYEQYSQNRDATNCRACHGDFRASPYISLHDGESWGDDAHDVHRNGMLNGDCDTCHSPGPRFPVLIDDSAGGEGLDSVSCVGCHGRALDDSVANGGACTISDCGPGAGLRQHHFRAGETICLDCHDNADPANYMPVGEDEPPAYYFSPDANHPNKPTDACNDDFVGGPTGLDNDGDQAYDGNDPDCGAPPGCTSDAECDNGEFCDGAETCDTGTGECLPGTPVNVDDGVGCTDDSCDEVNDVVVNAPNDTLCDDGAFCNGAETCDAVNDCQAGTPVNVDDGVGCTNDSCDEANDVVVNTPNDALCDDGAFCNGAEICDAVNDCQAGTPVNVDDGVGCTDDSCDEVNDVVVNTPNDALCDDAAFCNGAETCDAVNDCQAGTPVNVDDGVGCTNDSCDEANDVVVNTPNDALCDDGAFCNGAETCDAVNDCQAGTPVNVDDGVGCTNDSCDEANDVVVNTPNDALCDDGAFCNGAETCDAVNDCQAGPPVNVDDGVGCTDDSCDEVNDAVVNTPNDALCDDAAFCNGAETCDAVNDCQAGPPPCDPATETCDEIGDVCEPIGCQSDAECDNGQFCDGAETCDTGTGLCLPGTPVDCSDGVNCTVDSCNEGTDSCDNAPDDGACNDGAFCNGDETCDAVNDCQAGTPVNVDDGVGCTDDSCDEVNDAVVNTPNDALCDDAAFCNGAETCDAVNDCQAGPPPCDPATETCDEIGDVCEPIGCQSDAECDNGQFCDGAETCDTGTGLCLPGTPVDCSDGVNCTVDSCNEGTDSCDNAPDDGACNDGAFCNGDETCDAVNDCQAGTPVNVDDGVGCTDDSCDEVNDVVVNTPNDALCDDAAFCNGAETCDAVNDCQAGPPPCDPATETCDEIGDVCEPIGCQSDAECDNGQFCDGAETCDTGTGLCLPGTPVDCSDGVNCTVDSCNEGTDSCDNAPDDGACNDGAFCNGDETCDAVNDCQAGTPVNVDDGVGCTDDSCDEVNDVVVNTPNDALCDDAAFCNGAETCDAVNDCQAGPPPCDPATETCDEIGDVCEPIGCQSDAECDNGQFCDGAETCDTGTGLCLPGTPVDCSDGVNCTVDSCNEGTDSCDNAPDDGACNDGAFCNGDETCDAVNDCQAGTPVNVDDGVGCTDDSCDEVNDVVVNTPNDALCDDAAFCNGAETCDAVNDCQAGPPPCDPATETCDEIGDVCEPIGCQSDAECDNGQFCDGAETCDTGTGLCLPGTPVDCSDGVNCTVDSCNEGTDSCDNAPDDGACNDGAFCNGDETCDAVNDCQAGTPVNVDDGVGCTDDSCDEVNDVVVNTPNDALCDDAAFCNGAETCDAVNDCQAGPPPCDPATETCDEIGDVCEPIGCQSDAECDNGAFCDGAETCDFGTGECLAGTPPCDPATETCDEVGNVCEPSDEICRTPGFWGARGGDEKAPRSQNITQAVIDQAIFENGFGLDVCGTIIDNTDLANSFSAIEAICVSVTGDLNRQLVRQATAAALNCVLGECNAEHTTLLATCNDLCAGLPSGLDINECIDGLDCFNNGGDWDGSMCTTGAGFCAIGEEACDDVNTCQGPGDSCLPDDTCHDRDLCPDLDDDGLINGSDFCFEPPGPASSPKKCNAALKNDTYVP